MPFPYRGEDRELNETTRAEAPGSYARLPDGMTHYELSGPAEAPVVVLVHGFSVPGFIYDPTFEYLCASGFRVLRYDLFGRGWSDRPALPNNMDLFVRQLHDLLDALGMNKPVTLTGLSMGGPITASFTEKYSQAVAANILIDPSGTYPIRLGILGLLSLPLAGELVLGLLAGEPLVRSIASDFFDPAQVEQFQERYRVQMRFGGFRRSILSTIRNHMLGDFSGAYRAMGRLGKPTLLLWGRNDRTVPLAHSADLVRLIPQCEFKVIEGSSHIPHYEKPEEVNPLLSDFLHRI